jgi:hypothetical protein
VPLETPSLSWSPSLGSEEERDALDAIQEHLDAANSAEALRRGITLIDALIELQEQGCALIWVTPQGERVETDPVLGEGLPISIRYTTDQGKLAKRTRRWSVMAREGDCERVGRIRAFLQAGEDAREGTAARAVCWRDVYRAVVLLVAKIVEHRQGGLDLWADGEPSFRLVMVP